MDDDRTMELPEPEKVIPPSSVPGRAYFPPSPPWSDNAKLAVIMMAFILVVFGIYLTRNVLAVAALAGLIAFLVAPLIRLLHFRLRVPRGLALLVAYVVVFIGTLAFGFIVVNEIVISIKELDPVGLVEEARVWLLGEIDADNHLVIFGLTVDMTGLMDVIGKPVGPEGSDGIVVDAENVLDILGRSLSSVRTVAGFCNGEMITSGDTHGTGRDVPQRRQHSGMHSGLLDGCAPSRLRA